MVSQNVWGRRGAWAERRAVLRDGLHALRPDLVALHETIQNDEYDQVGDLLGPDFHVAHQTAREPPQGGDVEEGQGFSIASRWPLGAVRELDLHVTPRTADFACSLLAAEILVPEPIGPLLFVFHNPSWRLDFSYEREMQAVAAARFVESLVEQGARHVVMVGDLDADPVSSTTRFWTGRQSLDKISVCYRDVWESTHPGDPGHTFTPHNPLLRDRDWPFRRIDYLFVRCDDRGPTLDIAACERIFDEPIDGVWASDHFGLVADLTVRSRP
jgi:endonuclease/exonuclease/phosphatase family metal-dependent hydrolase